MPPRNETGGSTKAARLRPHCAVTVSCDSVTVNDLRAHWRNEARRLFGEYQRTGNPSHLEAFRTHRAAMRVRATEGSR